MKNRKLIEDLKDQSTWRLLGLGLITYGVYFAYYMRKQSRIINNYVGNSDKISEGMVITIFIMSYVSLALFFTYLFVDEGHPIAKVSDLFDKVWGIMLIVWGYAARGRVNSYCRLESKDKNWFHGFWTFLFSPLYFNYKVNAILETKTEQVAPADSQTRR